MNDVEKPASGKPKTDGTLLEKIRDNLLLLVFSGLFAAIVKQVYDRIAGGLLSQPWHVIWFLLPLAAAAWLAWLMVRGRPEIRLRGWFGAFFVLYVVAFSLAAGSSLLDWKRTPVGFEGQGPRNFLALSWLEDWHYWLAGRAAPPANDIVVVTRDDPAGRTLADARMDVVRLIGLATANQARAVVLDLYFDEQEPTSIDALLCSAIEQAEKANVPVVAAYQFDRMQDRLVRKLPPPTLRACLTPDRQGHAIGFREPDLVVRLIPVYFQNDPTLPALALQAARRLASRDRQPAPSVPDDDLLQFLPPGHAFTRVRLEDLFSAREPAEVLRDRVIVAGTLSNADRVATPFGVLPGVVAQATGLYAIRTGHFVRRKPWWASFFVILVVCYVLTTEAAAGAGIRRLVRTAALMSALVVVALVVTMYGWLVWLDAIYPLVAIWLLVALLPPGWRAIRERLRGNPRRTRPAPPK